TFTVIQIWEPEYNDGDWQYPDEEYRIVHRLCVNPKFQGRGVAGKTLRHIEEELRRQKIGAVRLDTFTKNPSAIALYTGNGYEKRGFADWRMGRFYLMEKKL
ncbi:MAG: GNAT family N-acetyltransferase, partial [Lachnospiraceae bacterium]|nr:GNAT family N-acetyltransferase [Lachnospiraceae bacterium]